MITQTVAFHHTLKNTVNQIIKISKLFFIIKHLKKGLKSDKSDKNVAALNINDELKTFYSKTSENKHVNIKSLLFKISLIPYWFIHKL